MPSFTSVRALAVLALLVVAGLAAWLWLAGGGDDAADAALANAETLDWSDLIPPRQSAAAVRTRDGNLPRGVVQHGELGPAGPPGPGERVLVVPPDLATTLGGTGNLDAPARRLSDALGGLGNLKALQPRGGEARAELDGRLVRMAGFVAPLAFQGSRISQSARAFTYRRRPPTRSCWSPACAAIGPTTACFTRSG
jgi:hypothetical protein